MYLNFRKPIVYTEPRSGRALSGLGRLGNVIDDIVSPLVKAGTDVVETVTGAKAQEQAQQNAIQLAQIRAQQDAAISANTSQTLRSVLPVGLAVAGGLIAVAIVAKALR